MMGSYYLVKPLRDAEMTRLQAYTMRVYAGTFATACVAMPLYSILVGLLTRKQLLIAVTHIMALVFGFFAIFMPTSDEGLIWPTAFVLWINVSNLFLVAMFWSVMADVFRQDEGQAWFGEIAAAGTIGTVLVSLVLKNFSSTVGRQGALFLSIGCVEIAMGLGLLLISQAVIAKKQNVAPKSTREDSIMSSSKEQAIGGGLWSGFLSVMRSPYLSFICLYAFIGKLLATYFYNNLQQLLAADTSIKAAQRSELFASMNVYSQSGTLIFQCFAAGFLMRKIGLSGTLAIPGAFLTMLLIAIHFDPDLQRMTQSQVIQQILGYGLMAPAQHVLFTVVSREEKYQSKGFIDTVVFRGSDTASSFLVDALRSAGVGLALTALWMLPVSLLWLGVGLMLGSSYLVRSRNESASDR
jgi:ATP:ADP antiporter, AAA family